MRQRSTSSHRLAFASASATLVFTLAACGGGSDPSSQVASLGTDVATGAATDDTVAADTQEQWLAFAQCMRDNGVAMEDPTFDAEGNLEQGGFGPDAGIDMRSDEVRTAMDVCSDLMPAFGPGGDGGAEFDRTAIQEALNTFTECLRDEGLDVDDVDFAAGPGGDGPPGGQAGPPASGDVQVDTSDGGGFQGGPPPGDGAPGEGFDPTARILEQLGLDSEDSTVTAAVDACSAALDGALPGGGATTTTVNG